MAPSSPPAAPLPRFDADLMQCSVSGLSSGAFMTVQLHLAHSSMFVGAGVIAGGPYRCAESFRAASPIAEDAYVQNSLFICMNPLIPQAGPNAERLVEVARQTATRSVSTSRPTSTGCPASACRAGTSSSTSTAR